MLYKFDNENNSLEMQKFYDFSDLKGKEKDLENLLASNLGEIYTENGLLMPIFQERQWQAEPDLCALDKEGNLIIFELKRGFVLGDTTIQIMRYAQELGQKNYSELNVIYNNYINAHDIDLKAMHAQNFGLEMPLKESQFNKKQFLVIVGNSTDTDLMNAVDYWKSKGINIDYLPYRFYEINEELYFEFFAKPYDYHINPRDKKGIIFDTNATYDSESVWDMFKHHKISAYGDASNFVYRFNKNDYVLYYQIGYGVIGAGQIIDSKVYDNKDAEEKFRKVKLLTPEIKSLDEICCISPSELTEITGKNFYYASTVKSPYLSEEDAKAVIDELNKKYEEETPIF